MKVRTTKLQIHLSICKEDLSSNSQMHSSQADSINLQACLQAEKEAARQAGLTCPIQGSSGEHAEAIREYANFLLHVPNHGQIKLSWSQVTRCVPVHRHIRS